MDAPGSARENRGAESAVRKPGVSLCRPAIAQENRNAFTYICDAKSIDFPTDMIAALFIVAGVQEGYRMDVRTIRDHLRLARFALGRLQEPTHPLRPIAARL